MLNRRQLRGHTKSILCVSSAEYESSDSNSASSEYNRVIVSGSEDCTVRLWDLRVNRAQKCITGCFDGNPVDSVCLHPSHSSKHLLHVGSGSDVYIFDLRKEGILDRQPLAVVNVLPTEAESDVNAIAVHPKGHLLAAASDDGGVHLVDLTAVQQAINDSPPALQLSPAAAAPARTGRLGLTAATEQHGQGQQLLRIQSATRRLNGGHENIASSIAFRPVPTSSDDVVSGGFDCKAILWDHSVGRRKSHADLGGQGGASGLGINPPFVHTLAYSEGGKYLFCGTGDGSISVREASGLGEVASEEGHDSFTSCVHVPHSAHSASNSSSDDLAEAAPASASASRPSTARSGVVAFSGGNDGKINAWHLQEGTGPKPKKRRGKSARAGGGAANRRGQLVNLWALEHGSKINALTTWAGATVRRANQQLSDDDDKEEREGENATVGASSNHSFHLFVADTSKDLSVYTYKA